ncbi:cytochrome P450 6k1-like [Danaus plexippus]|uniref:cytochrome P450 6k1-like n=1 Tax=Danaus plexippus TaxID=13037 RepID=UPI002AB2B1BF|nr:cytochrome P450 6k1-like [Danaus plexippus]
MFSGVLLFTSLVIIFGLLYIKWRQVSRYWSDRGVFYLAPNPFLGSLNFLLRENAALWLIRMYEQCRRPYMGIWLIWKPALLVNCPNLARKILNQDFVNFRDRHISSGTTDPVGSLNLFTVKDPLWSNIRSKITGIFTNAKLKSHQDYTRSKAKELVQRIQNDGYTVLHLKDLMVDYATDVIGTFAFGVESNATLTGEGPLRDITRDFIKLTLYRGLSMFSIFFWPEVTDIFRLKFFPRSSTKYFCEVVDRIMTHRKKENIRRNDLIDCLIKIERESEENNEKLPNGLIVAQAAVLLLGGFDTSAMTLTYAIYEIAHCPDIQEKLYRELLEAKERYGNEDFDMQTLGEMTYLNCVIQEALRKYAAMTWLDRIAQSDYKIDDTLTIQGGTPVYINILGMHYDPEYFPDPYTFNPDRFLPENNTNIKPYTFMPFGEGPRSCIGKRFGYMTMRTALAALFLNYEIFPLPNTPTPAQTKIDPYSMVYTPGEKLRVEFVPRNK